MVGDFNIHIDDVSCSFAADFINLTESFNFIQHVSGATHIKGHTLDLLFILGLNIDSALSEELHFTDHECVVFNLSFNVDSLPSKRLICSWVWNSLSVEKFSVTFDPSVVLASNINVYSLVISFNSNYSVFWRRWPHGK